MVEFSSFRSIIELWPTREACATEIGAGSTAAHVSKWWQRDSIPDDWWLALLRTATASMAGVTADILTRLASRPLPEPEPAEARA